MNKITLLCCIILPAIALGFISREGAAANLFSNSDVIVTAKAFAQWESTKIEENVLYIPVRYELQRVFKAPEDPRFDFSTLPLPAYKEVIIKSDIVIDDWFRSMHDRYLQEETIFLFKIISKEGKDGVTPTVVFSQSLPMNYLEILLETYPSPRGFQPVDSDQ